jgi:hypothetical protein
MLGWIKEGIIWVINQVIAGFAAMLEAAIALLPNFPDMPDAPAPMVTAYKWVSWAFPVGTLINIFAFVAAAWLLWQAVAIAMRWLKVGDV